MCGIVGVAEPSGAFTEEGARALLRPALGRLAHRGPDGSGVRAFGPVALGQTRLAVRDPHAPGAAQPLVTPAGDFALVFNGELYDDERLRAEIGAEVAAATGGRGFATRCDAETLLWALALRGTAVLDRLRGMYALAFVDVRRGRLVLARDPLGVKPLFTATTRGGGLAFASEVAALRALQCVDGSRPDEEMVAAYLATSRRTLFGRTLFAGIRSLEPGEVVAVELGRSGALRPRTIATRDRFAERVAPAAEGAALAGSCKEVLEDAVRAHLVSDVPLCSMLSGGLDSAIIARVAADAQATPLATWCAAGVEGGVPLGEDPVAAERCADALGTRHSFVPVDEATFVFEWRAHVAHLEQPLSTPNEVAIVEVAQAIRASGAVVALSGEGADELFGGYGDALAAYLAHAASADDARSAARMHFDATAWFGPAAQAEILRPGIADALSFAVDAYGAAYERERALSGPDATALEPHLRLQRAVNLTSLLERLDAATMRASVEGRTPFADVRVARYADALPAAHKFTVDAKGAQRTKIVLREAFARDLPAVAVERPKASFPIPFERWAEPAAREAIRSSEFVASLVDPAALTAIEHGAMGEQSWRAWWLLGNLALFGDVAFGARVASRGAA